MGLRGMSWLLSASLFLTACATPDRLTPAERLEFYRANSGEPVRSFHSPSRLWGWRAVGDSALTVWTSSSRGYLLELAHRCPDMAFATSIGLTTRTSRVSAGFDSVVVARPGTLQSARAPSIGARSVPPQRGVQTNQTTCRIDTIRPLNTRVVREPKSELQEADVLERDPSEPDAPE